MTESLSNNLGVGPRPSEDQPGKERRRPVSAERYGEEARRSQAQPQPAEASRDYCSGSEGRIARSRAARLGPLAILWVAASVAAAGDPPRFNRDIRPILSDNCFRCHGPDKIARKTDLRLDQRDVAIGKGAIAPGDPSKSKLIERIFSDDPDFVMPPPSSRKKLEAGQKETLRRWIASGAEYQAHWSFIQVPKDVPVPRIDDPAGWIRNPIDAFVLSELRRLQLEPAVDAARETWLRRVTFDLTGLPPAVEELDGFLADSSPGAYEAAVDRLLGSVAYGERMANDWLDAARFADTFGYQADRDTHTWPWRDWLIRAFNDNLRYDKFILWQTAGDLLESPGRDQHLATAFNRLHRQTNEGGSIAEEFRVAYVADRVQTNGSVFLGLTLECSKCHDHKYDPISQRDFYQLGAFFDNIDEHGLYSHFTETAPTPALLLYEGDQEERHLDLLRRIRSKEAELARVSEEARARFAAAGNAAAGSAAAGSAAAESTAAGKETARLEAAPQPAASFSFEDAKPRGDLKVVPGKVGQAIELGGDDAFPCGGAGAFTRVTPFSFALWLRPAAHRPREVVLHRSVAAEDAAFRGYSLVLDGGHAVFSLIHFWPGNAIRVQTKQTLPAGAWTHVAVTYDGSSRAAGLRIYLNGAAAALDVVRDSLTRDIVQRAEWGDSGGGELALGARFRDVGFKGGSIDELLVLDQELTPIEVPLLGGIDVPPGDAARFEHHLLRRDDAHGAVRKELRDLRVQENDLVSQVRQIMVMKELPYRRPTRVLHRGAYDAPGEEVQPDAPASIFPFPPEYPRNRLGLARWMIDEGNPLVSRVAVNRFWQIFFGRGIVPTPEDFGSQGQPPTHPELLDWLARRFLESGWNVKALCKLIVLSSTYRQSSVPRDPKPYTEDPDNRWLARGPRHRLSAEQIRDNVLAASGLLSRRLGGPSVLPYQPAGLWEESGTGKSYQQSKGEGLYRRSLYTFWRRTSPPPSMTLFDAPSREVCQARRERTATPLQALVILNDPQFVEASRVLAEKLIQAHGGAVEARFQAAFRLLTSRSPAVKELEILSRLHREQLERFAAAPGEAKAFLSVGESPRDERLDPADHAATAVVVETLLAFDECVTKR